MMPSSEGEVTAQQIASEEQRVTASRLQETTMAQVAPEVVIGRSPARINPKRKPDKSKIFRIRTSEAEEPYICPYCRAELGSREQLEEHRLACGREPPVLPVPDTPRQPPHDASHPDELRRHQDVANNNQAHALKAREAPEPATPESRESSVDRNNGYDSDSNPVESGSLAQIRQLLAQSTGLPQVGPIAQQLAQSNLALEAIQNTRMALAQFATNAMNNTNANSPNNSQTMQEFALLQGTLYTLQHQQMMQLQLIQQLQAQLSIKSKEGSPGLPNFPEGEAKNTSESTDRLETPSSPTPTPRPPPPTTTESSHSSSSFISTLMERFKVPPTSEPSTTERPPVSSPLCPASTSGPPPTSDPRDRPLSPPMTASSIASSVIQHTEPPPPDEPNTLEMLQRTANNVLNNASQGLLTSRLIDDHRPNDAKDPYYKHRCRYCGKVFGSDSALQIHIRSHTGERPFKCNICGNRFTTKGNLKVHFQRHAARFPHVKMNPHPVPEHLDKFHPPLLAQLGELKEFPSPPTGPPNPFTSLPGGPALPPYRLPGPPPSLDHLHRPFNLLNLARQGREDEPENLTISEPRSSPDSLDPNFKPEKLDSGRMDVDEGMRSPHFDVKNDTNDHTSVVDMGEESQASDSAFKNDKLFNVDKRFDQEKTFESEKDYNEDKSLEGEKRYDEDNRSSEEKALDEIKKMSDEANFEEESAFGKKYEEDKFEEDKFEGGKFEGENKFEEENKFEGEKYEGEKYDNESNFERESRLSKESFLDSQEMRTLMEKKSPERDLNADQTPLDIRVRTERELKDYNEGNGTGSVSGGGSSGGGASAAKEEQDRDSSDSRSVTSEQPTDLRMRPDFRPLGMPTIPFSGPRMPLNFPFLPGLPTSFPPPMGPPPNMTAVPPGIDPAKDPNIYTNLLPKPGSNDNSWEALIEIQKTSETMKLEQLVNNIENKLTDPNQCVICHRVLSCKSALQMHYRTHTGERPFKCKICGRAFTTKGNLKTHMGVHRAKPPMRMLHQCPVCHKKYTNALVLQQHIRQHTGEPTDLSPEQIAAAEVRDYPHMHTPTSLPQMMPSGFPLPPPPLQGFPPLPLHLRFQLSPEAMRHREMMESEERGTEDDKYLRPFSTSSRSSSTGSAEQRTAEDLTMRAREDSFNGMTSPRVSVSPTPSDYSDIGDRSHDAPGGDSQVSPSDQQQVLGSAVSPAVSTGSQDGGISLPLDLVSRPHPNLYSPFGLFPPPLTTAAMTPSTHSLPGLNPLFLPNVPGRGNTTCQLCFKTFACQSALEIHYRSHTKERPFKCSICDRGFSTKGNMKQHMLTHKIRDGCRDLPQDGASKANGTSVSTPETTSSISPSLTSPSPLALPASLVTSLPATLASPLPSSLHSPLPTSLHSPLSTSLHSPLPTSIHSPLPTSIHSPLPPSLPPAVAAALLHQAREEDKMVDFRVKREREGENMLPVPKRASGPGCEGELLEGAPPEAEPQPTPDAAPCPSPAPEVMPLTRT
ncbi:homeotic protein spalt-major-like isoform X3 [Portunus trituberculatus]|uniref:homeotic protein spalt-major-like isoform X3 n=1 Tax=Portunus trituberculatus TaxID=210409 RepID=UPI001E1CD7E8|nr:homeotic protein spalt-major-like isoform X3 [Portunus trituberculatus]